MCDSTGLLAKWKTDIQLCFDMICNCLLYIGQSQQQPHQPHLAFIVTFHVCPGGEGPPHADIEAKKGGGGGGGYHLHNRTSLQLCT